MTELQFPALGALPPLAVQSAVLVLLAGALLWLLWQTWRWYMRRRSRRYQHAMVTAGAFEHLRDVLVPDGQGGWVYVDYLLLTARGVVVVDLRNVPGNIFGGDQMTVWTVMHRNRRETFDNPQTGLYDRLAAVRTLVGELPVDGRIVFGTQARFPKGLPKYTVLLSSLTAEYPAADRGAMAALLERWMPEWKRLSVAVMTGAQARRKPRR